MTIRHQNILTYPTLNFSQSEGLMTKMGINAGGAVEIWYPHMKNWCVEDVDHSMNIKGQPELLVQFLGVTHCLGFEELIGEVPDEQPTTAIDNGKRRLDTDGADMSLVLEARHAVASTWIPSTPSSMSPSTPWLSPCSASITPFYSQPTPSLFLSPFQSPTFTGLDLTQNLDTNKHTQPNSISEQPFPAATMPNYDSLWQHGFVHVPNQDSWPSGMYARDMAWALMKLKELKSNIETHFCAVFPGVPYIKPTYYRQRDAFFKSTTKEIVQCRALMRGANGLWVNWRGASSGWKIVAERHGKKVSNMN